MNILFTEDFWVSFDEILDFIALDSTERALKFKAEILEQIKKIPAMPLSYRKNPRLNNQNVRDLIYKGYIITFSIEIDVIKIVEIYKSNMPKFKI